MSFLSSAGIGMVSWISPRPEYQVAPVFKKQIRGKKVSISEGLVGMSVCAKIGLDLLCSFHSAKLTF